MSVGLRRIELIEHGIDQSVADTRRANHVVGVDESGNSNDGPLVMVAVQCPRSCGETLAELLIKRGLEPWKSKSSSSPKNIEDAALSERVEGLIQDFTDVPITWHAVAGWGKYNKEQRGAIASIVSSKTMTGGEAPDFEGPAAIIHDGGHQLYGTRMVTFRQYASRQFRGFEDRFTPVYLSYLIGGDKTYPEITAADYIAGYLKSEIEERGIEGVTPPVQRIDKSWRSSNESPLSLYRLRSRTRRRQNRKEERVAAWMDGRQTSYEETWGGQPLEALVDRLNSERVREYILEEL